MIDIIRPDEIKVELPVSVKKALNDAITERWDGREANVTVAMVANLLANSNITIADHTKWLIQNRHKISAAYREHGWSVRYIDEVRFRGWRFEKKR